MPVSGVAPRILVVEDEPVINQAVTDRLRGSGYDVVQAWDGPDAVAQCADTAPDLVLLDVMLPGSTATRCAGGWRRPGHRPGPRLERFGTLTEAGGGGGGGTGLGLAIARWVTDLHGGTIHFVEPEPPGTGARARSSRTCGLIVVWAAARKAPRTTAADLAWLRGSPGLLCALTVVVVASALYRMHVYQEAYGFTRLRRLVDVFEAWLGLLVLGVMAAGLALRAAWLPRAALISGAGLLLALAAVNPDAWIARHNLDRYDETGKVDWHYLQGLSADAVPVLATLPDEVVGCALTGRDPGHDDWLEWNLGRQRAEPLVRSHLADREHGDAACAPAAD